MLTCSSCNKQHLPLRQSDHSLSGYSEPQHAHLARYQSVNNFCQKKKLKNRHMTKEKVVRQLQERHCHTLNTGWREWSSATETETETGNVMSQTRRYLHLPRLFADVVAYRVSQNISKHTQTVVPEIHICTIQQKISYSHLCFCKI